MDTVAQTMAEGPLMDVPMVGTAADTDAGDTKYGSMDVRSSFCGFICVRL